MFQKLTNYREDVCKGRDVKGRKAVSPKRKARKERKRLQATTAQDQSRRKLLVKIAHYSTRFLFFTQVELGEICLS